MLSQGLAFSESLSAAPFDAAEVITALEMGLVLSSAFFVRLLVFFVAYITVIAVLTLRGAFINDRMLINLANGFKFLVFPTAVRLV